MALKTATPAETPARTTEERPHLFDLLLALIEARATHVDVLDTAGGAELEKYFRARRTAHRTARAQAPDGEPRPPVSSGG